MAKKVLVTGCSGRLGKLLVKNLLAHPLVERVVGVDAVALHLPNSPKFKHYPADIRDEFYVRSILAEENIDAVFHLAFTSGEPRDAARAMAVNVGGTLTVLEAASKSQTVQKLIILGSTTAYGARSDNALPLTEDSPLRAATLHYGIHNRQVEEQVGKAAPDTRRSLQVSFLRICSFAGGAHPLSPIFALPFAVSAIFRKGGLQFICDSDLMRVLIRALEAPKFAGKYNVAPDDHTTMAALCKKLNKFRLPLPYTFLWVLFYLIRRFNQQSTLSETMVSHLAYPIVVSNEKIKKELGVKFEKGAERSFFEPA